MKNSPQEMLRSSKMSGITEQKSASRRSKSSTSHSDWNIKIHSLRELEDIKLPEGFQTKQLKIVRIPDDNEKDEKLIQEYLEYCKRFVIHNRIDMYQGLHLEFTKNYINLTGESIGRKYVFKRIPNGTVDVLLPNGKVPLFNLRKDGIPVWYHVPDPVYDGHWRIGWSYPKRS